MTGNSPAFSTKERKQIIAGLVAQGGESRETKHTTLIKFPDGTSIGIPKTSSDWRSRLNARAEATRLGLEWPLDSNPGKRPLNDAITRVTEALANMDGPPDVFKIQRWLREHGKPVGHQDTIKNALRALGYEEVRGRKTGRGYQWKWELRADAVPTIEEDDVPTTVTAEEIEEAQTAVLTVVTDHGDETFPQPLPAKLSEDAEWALAEAQRLEARAVEAETDAARAWAEVQRLTHLVTTEREDHRKATARIDQLLRERDDLRSQITNQDIDSIVARRNQSAPADEWEAQVDPAITIGAFTDGAKQYGLEAVIRLRKTQQ